MFILDFFSIGCYELAPRARTRCLVLLLTMARISTTAPIYSRSLTVKLVSCWRSLLICQMDSWTLSEP